MAQLIPLPLTVSCSSKIQIGFTFLVPAHLGSPGQRAVKRVCVLAAANPLLWAWQAGDTDQLLHGRRAAAAVCGGRMRAVPRCQRA